MTHFATIADKPGYRFGSDGTVWTRLLPGGGGPGREGGEWRLMMPDPHDGGYLQVGISVNGKRKKHLVHRLILEAFRGPCPPGMECLHENRVRNDNRLENIRWGTTQENADERIAHGTQARGENQGSAKLTELDIQQIFRRRSEGALQRTIAAELGVEQTTIGRALRRVTWSHVSLGK